MTTAGQISQERFDEKMDALDAANPGPLARLQARIGAACQVLACADIFRQGCSNAGAMIGMSDHPADCEECTIAFLQAVKEAVKDV